MTETQEVPNAGYALEKIYFPEQSHKLLHLSQEMRDEPTMEFGWDWKFVDSDRRFEVLIHIRIGPTKSHAQEVKVTTCGVFSIVGDTASAALTDFVRLQGPAILVPYAREAIASMTGRSFFGPLYLPPLNIMKAIAGLDPEASTGARQLREGLKGTDSAAATQRPANS